jgi:hypothetical protein
MSDVNKTNKEYYEDASSEFRDAMYEWDKDLKFKAGDQLDETTLAELAEDSMPDTIHNIVKKPCDLMVGSFRDNPLTGKLAPVADDDGAIADAYGPLLKWIMSNRGNKYNLSYSFSDAISTGIGWARIDMDYSRDFFDGDITVKHVSPLCIYFDPDSKEADLSDCTWIMQRSFLSKDLLLALYPEAKAKISGLEERDEMSTDFQQSTYNTKRINVLERWYKVPGKKYKIYVNTPEGIQEFDAEDANERLQYEAQYTAANVRVIGYPTTKIKIKTETDDGIVLYDGDHPDDIDAFPFIRFLCWYEPSLKDWKWKVSGLPRLMRGIQEELNKLHQKLLFSAMSMPHGAYKYEADAVDDINNMVQRKGGIQLIKMNKGRMDGIQPMQTTQLNQAMMEYLSIVASLPNQVGPNPDLLGVQMSKSEPGMNIELRQKQGIATLKDPYDHANMAVEQIFNYIIKLVNSKWSRRKIERITSIPLPEDWEDRKGKLYFDVTVNLVQDSPSYRFAVQAVLLDMLNKIAPVVAQTAPQVVLKFAQQILTTSEIPDNEKQDLIAALTPPPPPIPNQAGTGNGESPVLDENGNPVQPPAAEGGDVNNTAGAQ